MDNKILIIGVLVPFVFASCSTVGGVLGFEKKQDEIVFRHKMGVCSVRIVPSDPHYVLIDDQNRTRVNIFSDKSGITSVVVVAGYQRGSKLGDVSKKSFETIVRRDSEILQKHTNADAVVIKSK